MANVVRGDYIVGLQPDTRMPHDWLRMVSRVFAAYRQAPLEKSVVAHIDGLWVSILSENNARVKILIEPGQCFVDDQFLGFLENSTMVIRKDRLPEDEFLCIALNYQWVNQMPPQEPKFLVTPLSTVENAEQYLCLGLIKKNSSDGSITLIDKKKHWYDEIIEQMIGDAEVDPGLELPYTIAINEEGSENTGIAYNTSRAETTDIGWALDLHHSVGNNVDYNVRLHTNQGIQGWYSDALFVNGDRVPTITENNGVCDLIVRNDFFSTSDGSTACLKLMAKVKTIMPPHLFYKEGGMCLDSEEENLTISSPYNELVLTKIQNKMTINGWEIMHYGNVAPSGETIYYIGKRNSAPDTREEISPEGNVAYPPLQSGDLYYDTTLNLYFVWDGTAWSELGGKSMSSHEIVIDASTTEILFDHEVDKPTFIWVSGVLLSASEYDASDSTKFTFNKSLKVNDIVRIFAYVDPQTTTLRGVNAFGSSGGGTTVIKKQNPTGTLIDYAGSDAPEGYLLCDGSVYNIDRYPELFRIIGTTYGKNGDDTFKVPEVDNNPFKKYIKF
jgi:hypothetical protein